ncbi:MAG: hypothetical protein V7605_83 [Acidimicrobiaceae bacterium]|jgi:hypothetical protein
METRETGVIAAPVDTARVTGPGPTIWRDDLIAVLLSATVIGGLLLDGWNHLVLQKGKLGSFFTPWHGLLYAGFTANAIWVISRNKHLWKKDVKPDPHLYKVGNYHFRYPFAMLGLVLVFTGMMGDLVWHTVLGEETDVARVIAPFHIILFFGASLLIAAPLRSAWYAPEEYPRNGTFVRLLPPLLSVLLLTVAASFLLQWMSPFMEWSATPLGSLTGIVPDNEGLQTAMASRVVLADILLVGPLLLAMRRWTLPPGSATLVFTVVALCMAGLTSFHLLATVFAAAAGGVAVDLMLWWGRRLSTSVQMFLLAGVTPVVIWPIYFVILAEHYGANWPVDFYLGVASLAALVGLVVAFLAGLPIPEEADTLHLAGGRPVL